MRPRLHCTYFFVITILLLSAIGAAVYILLMDYDSLIASVAATVHKNGLEEKLRNEIFTRKRFILLQRVAILIFALAPFCFWLALRYRLAITGFCRFIVMSVWQCVKETRRVFKNNSPQQNRSVTALIIVILLFFIYRMITSFLAYDEMWSYNYYTANHFYYSFFTYSNYPLFEMSTHFFKWLPLPMKINLRLSPFIFGTASCLLLYACLRKYFNSHLIALAGLTFFAFSPLTVQYMVNARGVMHELFFAIAGIFSFLFWLANPDRKRYLAIYFVAGVCGLYAMFTHILLLFFLLVAGIWLLIKKDKAAAFLFIKVNVVILAGYLFLYAPILITTGASVYANVIRSTPSYYGIIILLPYIMRDVFMAYAGYSFMSVAIFLAAIAALLLLKNKLPANSRLILVLAVGLPLSTVFFYLVTGFPYAGRALAFGALSIPLMACLIMQLAQPWLAKNNAWVNRLTFFAIAMALLADSYFYIPVHSDIKKVVIVSRLLIDNKITSCYDNSSPGNNFFYYYPGIEYYYRIENKTIELTLSGKNSMRYKPLLTGDKYDCIVYDASVTDSSRAASFHELYIDPAGKFKIWIRNDLK